MWELQIGKYFIIFSKVYDYGSMEVGYANVYQVLQDQGFRCPVAELIGGCKPPDMDARNGSSVRTATMAPSLHTPTISLFQAMTTFT